MRNQSLISHLTHQKCAGTQDVSDAPTKSLPRPAYEKHREYMVGTKVPLSAFYVSTVNLKMPIVAYVIKLPKPFSPRRTSLRLVQVDNFYHPHRGRVK